MRSWNGTEGWVGCRNGPAFNISRVIPTVTIGFRPQISTGRLLGRSIGTYAILQPKTILWPAMSTPPQRSPDSEAIGLRR